MLFVYLSIYFVTRAVPGPWCPYLCFIEQRFSSDRESSVWEGLALWTHVGLFNGDLVLYIVIQYNVMTHCCTHCNDMLHRNVSPDAGNGIAWPCVSVWR
jgi:hypothetical protein